MTERPITVAICTKDRPYQTARAISSVLRSGEPLRRLIVVDQSDSPTTAHVAERYGTLVEALFYIKDEGRSSSRGHNVALRSTDDDVVVFIDDDCQVSAGWATHLSAALLADPEAAIAFGEVRPVNHDPTAGYVVGFVPSRRRRIHGRMGKLSERGIGANMAVRRAAILAIGGFDEQLGPGAPLHACLDGDIAYRALARGWSILHMPDSVVIHDAVRPWHSGRQAIRNTYAGIGAAYFKYLRTGDPVAALLLGQQVCEIALEIAGNAARRRRPIGLGRLIGLFRGIRRSFDCDVDKSTLTYRAKPKAG